MGKIKIIKGAGKAYLEAQKKFKKVIDKKKGKDLDWSDLSKSYKIFTKK